MQSDVEDLTHNRTIRPHILDAMGTLLRGKFGARFSGLVSRAEMMVSGAFFGLDKTKRCIQLHFNDSNHFFASTWDPEVEEVVVLDSAALELSWQARYQLWLLYGQGEPEGQIRIRWDPVQR